MIYFSKRMLMVVGLLSGVAITIEAKADDVAATTQTTPSPEADRSNPQPIYTITSPTTTVNGNDAAPVWYNSSQSLTPIYAGAEAVWLRSQATGQNAPLNQFASGVRLWAGYQTESGIGVRTRYFDYHSNGSQTELLLNVPSSRREGMNIQNLDLEVTDKIFLGNWAALISGGARYSIIGENTSFSNVNSNGNSSTKFHGFGPTFGFQGDRVLGQGFSLFANGQQSILLGSSQYVSNSTFNHSTSTYMSEQAFPLSVSEVQLGIKYSFSNFYVRTGIEGQWYQTTTGGDAGGYGINSALVGYFVGAGINF